MDRKIFNLERDIRKTDWLTKKVRYTEVYAQNLYAALCNNRFQPKDVWGILTNLTWATTWREAAVLISDIREREDYNVWYNSGTGFKGIDFVGFVEESYVTEEIENDLNQIGWLIVTRHFIDI